MTTADVVVIGGGHNGLTCAAYLAKAGLRVTVLESRHLLGGAAVTEEHLPGFKYSACSYVVSLLRPHIIRDLELAKHGLEILPLDCSFTPLPNGDSLARWGDAERTRREISRFSKRDAEAYREFGKAMGKVSRLIKPIIEMVPPDPSSWHPGRLLENLSLLKVFDRFTEADRVLKLKMFTMSAVDFLDQWFESETLKATMSVSGIIGTFLGVRSPGTAYVLLHHYMGEIDGSFRSWGFCRGGTGQISMAIASAAQRHGAKILTESPVEKVLVEGGRAVGVVLEHGEEIRAKHVVSGVDPHRTFLGLVGEEHLDPEFAEHITRFKMRGSSGKVNLALDRLPEFTCRPGNGPHLRGDIAIAPSIDYLERAYDEAKYGDFSKRPYLNVVIPSLSDPSVAPPGKHVMSIFVQYAPFALKEGAETWPARREEFGDAVIDTLAEYCPTLKESILHRQVLTPWDLDREYGLTQGNIFHGELSLEQLFFLRPAPRWARHSTPISNLWLAASGSHPGGGIMGAPGANAARAILEKG
ncbi:MAG: NAD(P)/FAD-dependent oxidoreductase [Planctomycetota bacterium]|jgi:phytoene dehydrogenase-like protein|nr:NAD(P)/FAD-dependent oxidoreductase [Planctomycetota bacterium]